MMVCNDPGPFAHQSTVLIIAHLLINGFLDSCVAILGYQLTVWPPCKLLIVTKYFVDSHESVLGLGDNDVLTNQNGGC